MTFVLTLALPWQPSADSYQNLQFKKVLLLNFPFALLPYTFFALDSFLLTVSVIQNLTLLI